MSILFSEIYSKAINLFDDPKITQAYKTNTIQFNKIMYGYLQNAIMMFNNPLIVSQKLTELEEPQGIMEKFPGDGSTKSFTLDAGFELKDNCYYNFIQGDLLIDNGVLDRESRTVTFPDVLPEGQEYAFEQYYPGSFTADFTSFNTRTNKVNAVVEQGVMGILARLLVKSWAENERNLLLDIRNLMQDSDFKIMSNDRILKAKNEWVNRLDFEITQITNKLAWSIRFAGGSINTGIGRG